MPVPADRSPLAGVDVLVTRPARQAQRLSRRFSDPDRQADIGALQIKISGCINACGHHHVGDIGILGVDRKGEEYYQITLGGRPDESAAIGAVIGPAFSYDGVVGAVDRIVDTYLSNRHEGERFGDTYRRIGSAPMPDGIAFADRLDLDHLGAQKPEIVRTGRSAQNMREINDQ